MADPSTRRWHLSLLAATLLFASWWWLADEAHQPAQPLTAAPAADHCVAANPVAVAQPLQRAGIEPLPDSSPGVRVTIVDETGAALPDATLVRAPATELSTAGPVAWLARQWRHWATRIVQTVDDAGIAIVPLPEGEVLQLAATAPGHAIRGMALANGDVPDAVRLVVPRGGVLYGRLADAGLTTHALVTVQYFTGGDPDYLRPCMIVDRGGNFRSPMLSPGVYSVGLVVADRTAFVMDRLDSAVPLLGGACPPWFSSPITASCLAQVVAGGETRVELQAPAHGEVQGRVLLDGVPFADAIVFGSGPDDPTLDEVDPESRDSFTSFPNCRTDRDGRFRFLVSHPGIYQLRARQPRAAMWSEPVVVQVAPSERIQRDIDLHAATVRGRIDRSGPVTKDNDPMRVQIYRLQDASDDPWFSNEWRGSLESAAPCVCLDAAGHFAFLRLPSRAYVLRLVSDSNGILWTRALRTDGDEVIDLGRIDVPMGVEPRLECRLPPELGVIVRQCAAGSERGLFVRTVAQRNGGFVWGRLSPGRHRLQACEFGPVCLGDHGWRTTPVGEPIDVELRADGSCTPAIVWPDGLPPAGK